MKGIRFYLEYATKTEKNKATRKNVGKHTGNCIAVEFKQPYISQGEVCFGAYGGVFEHENSLCCGTSTTRGYLSENCKHISEQQAKEIHPNLFSYLEQ